MNIQGIGNQQAQAMSQLKQPLVRGKSAIAQKVKETIEAKADTKDAAEAKPSERKGQGVVGLLQEGHFKGVADVRLRINFHDQLQTMSTQKAGETLEEGSQEIVTNLDAKVQELGGEFDFADQVEGLMTSFKDEANGFIGTIQDGQFDSPAVLDGLRGAFTNLVDSLQAFAPVAADDPGEDAAVVGGTESTVEAGADSNTEPTEFSLALQSVQEWFEAEVTSLETTMSDLQAMPPLSEPRGNGVAYSRFVETYNELNGETGNNTEQATNTQTHGIKTEA